MVFGYMFKGLVGNFKMSENLIRSLCQQLSDIQPLALNNDISIQSIKTSWTFPKEWPKYELFWNGEPKLYSILVKTIKFPNQNTIKYQKYAKIEQ